MNTFISIIIVELFVRAYNNLYDVKEYEIQYLTEGKMKLAD